MSGEGEGRRFQLGLDHPGALRAPPLLGKEGSFNRGARHLPSLAHGLIHIIWIMRLRRYTKRGRPNGPCSDAGNRVLLDFLQLDPKPSAQTCSCLLDSLQEARIILQRFRDVVEHADLVDPESVLRTG